MIKRLVNVLVSMVLTVLFVGALRLVIAVLHSLWNCSNGTWAIVTAVLAMAAAISAFQDDDWFWKKQ